MTDRLPDLRPGEALDYEIDASGLLAEGETLVEGTSSVTVSGATKDSQEFTDSYVKIWLSGATQGQTIRVDARLKTSGGRTFDLLYVIPYGEPLTLDQVKAHLGLIDDDSRDDLIAGYLTAARTWVENYTGHVLVQREFVEYRDCFSRYLDLNRRPIVAGSVTIAYTDAAGSTQPYADAVFSLDRNPARIFPALDGWWPRLGRNGSIALTYTAGYDAGQEPQPLLQAILVLITAMFENRGSIPSDAMGSAEGLCDQYRTPVI